MSAEDPDNLVPKAQFRTAGPDLLRYLTAEIGGNGWHGVQVIAVLRRGRQDLGCVGAHVGVLLTTLGAMTPDPNLQHTVLLCCGTALPLEKRVLYGGANTVVMDVRAAGFADLRTGMFTLPNGGEVPTWGPGIRGWLQPRNYYKERGQLRVKVDELVWRGEGDNGATSIPPLLGEFIACTRLFASDDLIRAKLERKRGTP